MGILYACRFTAASVVGGRRRPSGSMQSASTKPTAPRARERSDSFSTSEPRPSTPSRLPRICGPSAIEPVSTLPEQALASAPADADANSGSGLHDPRPCEAPDNAADRRGRLKSHRERGRLPTALQARLQQVLMGRSSAAVDTSQALTAALSLRPRAPASTGRSIAPGWHALQYA